MQKTMQNLSQLRAKHALNAATGKVFKGAGDGEVVKKIPAMIRQNGILGALAFAKDKDKDNKGGHADVFRAIIDHLIQLGRIEKKISDNKNLDAFIMYLCDADEATLRAVTDEAMAYLNFLRRFAKKESEDGTD